MASVTLAESAKLAQDELAEGVIENIITVDRLFEVLPFEGIGGNAIGYNRENALGDVQVAGVGDTITAKAAATFTYVTSSLTTIIGDAEVNGLIDATRSDDNDQTAIQVASKAKSAGRKYRDMLVNGTGGSNQFSGLLTLVTAGQTITAGGAGNNGANLSFDLMDQLLDQVTDKDGEVDFIAMHSRTIRSLKALLRAQGGAGIMETLELPSGRKVLTYEGVPIFRNDWLPTNQTQGTATTATSVLAGCFDDGSHGHGVAGLTARKAAGIKIKSVGEKEAADEHITRVVWYAGLANFNALGLACLKGVLN